MSGPVARLLTVAALLAMGNAVLYLGLVGGRQAPTMRWPSDEGVYLVPGWRVSAPNVEQAWGRAYVTRDYYRRANDAQAQLVIVTSSDAKTIYRVGADVALLGSGFSVEPAGPLGAAVEPPYRAMLLDHQGEQALMIYTFGERRGLRSADLQAWGLVAGDALQRRPNDYFLLRLVVPLESDPPGRAADGWSLARAVFPMIADWYRR